MNIPLTTALTAIILLLIGVLFFLVYIAQKNISRGKAKKLLQRLEQLQAGALSSEMSVRRDTVIKLDNLLSKSLQYYFSNTDMCGDNLKLAKKIFRRNEYNDLWEVHKIRNKIVHDDYDISAEDSKKVYNIYRSAILKILR